jgi:hypothetical protein
MEKVYFGPLESEGETLGTAQNVKAEDKPILRIN